MKARCGKIARLSLDVRTELNERLECSEPGPELLEWLNGLESVQKVLKKWFGGVPVSKQNLSDWRQGGFEEWLARRELFERAEDAAELANDMERRLSGNVADHAGTILAAQISTLIANWDGEVDEKLEAKTRLLRRLGQTVVQLQRTAWAERKEEEALRDKREADDKAEMAEMRKKALAHIDDLLIHIPVMTNLYGGGTAGAKFAAYVCRLRRGESPGDIGLTPEDTFGEGWAAFDESRPVKPSQGIPGVSKPAAPVPNDGKDRKDGIPNPNPGPGFWKGTDLEQENNT